MSVLASTGVPTAWYIARAAGLVAFAFLTASVWLGLAMSTKLLSNRRQKTLFGWHQTLMWTALSMLVLHGAALILDPVMHFGLQAVVVPGLAPWRPLAVGSGVVAGWLALTLATSFHVRRRIGQKRWRLLHYASFAAFILAVGHAINVGTDLQGARGLFFAAVALAPVLWLVFARILMPRPGPRARTPRVAAHADGSAAAPEADRVPVAA
jgi:methionine sulfoxide reductase heme-binding subunit